MDVLTIPNINIKKLIQDIINEVRFAVAHALAQLSV